MGTQYLPWFTLVNPSTCKTLFEMVVTSAGHNNLAYYCRGQNQWGEIPMEANSTT